MNFWIEQLAIAVCAVSGALAARGKGVDLFGVLVLALVTAVGGGTLRDLCLGVRVFWITDPSYVLTASIAAVATFIVVRFHQLPEKVLLIADAFGLALFTIIGTEKALEHHTPVVTAVVLGVITGVAGGLIRDVLSHEMPMVFQPHIYLYATAAFVGATVFVLLVRFWPGGELNRFIGMITVLVLRLAAIRWQLKLPVLKTGAEK